METVKVARESEVPERIRAALDLKPGEELHIDVLERSMRWQRPRERPCSIKELRGIAKGMHRKDDYRDREERF